jgi:hypothetical protein
MAQVVEHLPSKYKVLSSKPHYAPPPIENSQNHRNRVEWLLPDIGKEENK